MSGNSETEGRAYRVLARKYRPQVLSDLIGQDAMVRTLTNAFAAGRIAHAFILTGVRGVGKTTTARIIARGLNCVGPDGTGGVTVTPCGVCGPCRAIAEGRHVDVLEMDAATHTQVERMRELLASVPYRPADSRMKVYIVDEVHMLSTASFNALLKTLEEPPEHVKFIFATTEIRKVPVTVLSRCQRFDLRRIEPETMLAHLDSIARKEGAEIDPDALALIVRAAEGSVRDALSLLDQALAHGGATIDRETVRAMLGLADRGRVIDLFEMVMRGDARAALAELGAQYAAGADPAAVLRDLAEVTHWISVLKVAPETADDPAVSPDERARGLALAGKLSVPVLARAWQMLLKALEELAAAPNAMMAAEMALIRLTHVADLPTPGELVRRLTRGAEGAAAGAQGGPAPARRDGPVAVVAGGAARAVADPAPLPDPRPAPDPGPDRGPASLAEIAERLRAERDLKLLLALETCVRPVSLTPGRLTFQPTSDAPAGLAAALARRLELWTGRRWTVSLAREGGGATLAETRAAEEAALLDEVRAHPLVAAALAAFPGAEIREIRRARDPAPGAGDPAAEPVPEDWDPIEAPEEED
ncbi:MAG: DNA polymerase III subunit gamma/tau [Alphaproteobacteria bacterium]|nr:MAG: DNA polymerase III subunit gamma/tau [Alphaproteobacteria bacterium]